MTFLPSPLPPRVEPKDGVKVITLADGGRWQDEENSLAGQIAASLPEPTACHLMLDFRHIGRITSAELGTLILLHKKLKAAGGRLTLFNLREEIYEVFAVTRLDGLLHICRETQA